MKATFELTGFDEYIESLIKAGHDVDLIARDALSEAAQDLQSALINAVPDVQGVNAEALREHINIRTPSGEGHYNYINVGFLHDIEYTPKGINIHARIVEFGSVWTPPHPFIRRTVAAFKNHFLQVAKSKLAAAGLVDP